ncbi:MAG: lipid-binding SYLF domain-containing protein [Deltaproteobacteria bacterium]|nr:lipid-binding SYLF domain-containing protein [Deltaproteobacteria bacterium]
MCFLISIWSVLCFYEGRAEEAYEAQRLVDMSALAFERFIKERREEYFIKLVRDSKGIFVCPQMLKGAFIFGLSGGNGIFLVWDEKERSFTGPVFYTLGGISFGLQAGGNSSELLLLFMTERGVTNMLTNSLKLGVDVGIAVGPVGMGAKAETANLSADIVAYYTSKGLFGGFSLEGGIIKVRKDLNKAYYGRDVTPIDILIVKNVKKDDTKRFTKLLRDHKKVD